MTFLRQLSLASLLILTTIACNNTSEKKQTDSTHLATFDGGIVSEKDIDLAIMELDAATRVVQQEERLAWYERLAKDIAISKIVIEEQQQLGTLEKDSFTALAYQAARKVQTNDFLLRNIPSAQAPTQEDLERHFKELYGDGRRPGKAVLSNIFIRYTDAKDKAAVKAELDAIRERILNGENFGQLATIHSDSETRHRNGALGTMDKDQMSEGLGNVIFALKPNEPSKPVFTKDGGHLFQAENIIPEKFFTIEDVRPQLVVAYQREAYLKALDNIAQKFPKPEPFQFQEKEPLLAMMQLGNPAQVLIQVGKTEITASAFHTYLQKDLGRTQPPDGWDKDQLYTDQAELAYREWIYQAIKPDAAMVDDDLKETYLTKRNQLWTDDLIRGALLEKALTEQEALLTYYENQKTRFQLPPKVRLKMLIIPLSGELSQMMTALEAAIPNLKAGKTNLEALAEQFNGMVTETESLTAQTLSSQGSKLYKFAFEVPEGDFSPPFRMQQGLTIFKVIEKTQPQVQPFSVARKFVAQDYLKHQGQILYKNFADEKLRSAKFSFNEAAAKRHGNLSETPTP